MQVLAEIVGLIVIASLIIIGGNWLITNISLKKKDKNNEND